MQSHSAMSSRVPTDASASSLAQEVNGPLQAQRTANATAPASSSSRVLDNSPSIFPTLTQPQAPHQLHSSSSTIHLPPQAMPPASLHRQSPVPASFTSTFHVQQSSSSGVSAAGLLPTPIGSTATRNAAQAGTVSAEAVPNNSTSGMSETRGRGSAAQLGIGVHSPGVRLHPVESLTQSVASSSTAPAQASLSSSSIAHALDTPLIRTTATPSSVVQDASSRTHTPPPPSSRSFSSPTKADTSRLARDILRSLGRPSATSPVRGASPHPPKETPDAKRKRTTESPASPSKKIRTMEVIDLTDVVEEIMTPAVQQQLEETRESQAVPQELRLEDLIRTETIPELPHVRAPSPFVPESAPPTSTPVSPTREYRDLSEPSHDSNVDAVNQFVEVFNRDGRELTYVSANASPARIPTPSGLSYSLLSPEPEHEPTPASAPVERVPLFLPSPASSHGEDVSNGHQNGGAPESGAAGGSFILNTDLLGVAPDLSAGPGPSTVKIRQMKVLSDDEASPTPVRRQRSYSRLVVDFVAVPPLPEWAMRMNAREEELRSVRGSQGTEDEAIVIKDDEEDEERARQEAKQQQVVQLSYSRLRESPCRWRGCDAVLNSADSLGRHVATHVEDDKTSYTCDWHGCAKAFSRKVALLRHLQTHAYIPIFCAYEGTIRPLVFLSRCDISNEILGCDRSFLTPRELLQHHSSYRHREARLKPSTVPFKHVDAEPIPPLPATLPAYMTEPRRITRHPIPKNTHTWLHKKVLENVTCFYFQGRRPKAAAATRSARLAERSAGEETEPEPEPVSTLELWRRKAQEEYEQFSREQSRRAPQPCGDIPSAEVTRLCDAGLVIWPPEACDSDEEVEAVVALPRDAGAGSNDKIEVDEPAQDDAGSEMREMVETMVGGVEGQPQRAVSRTAGDSSMAIAADGGWPDQSDGRVEQDEPGWTVLRQEEDEDKVEMLL
ncbi:hypothetical protein OBBRIDRAFT_124764 [Obba rivulosa]|uniref:C2H2-type domain-containing protein n=1 Tax=Obba rivulosa TaxID=1052685 RepID=A0A8E2DRV3_9APHY|nr:hypothetical protein OBBRIDRAFT_124764 [Obba rivulosa]